MRWPTGRCNCRPASSSASVSRALLQRPDWLFLDEATSALDETSEARLYRLLKERLPNATRVSVGHRSTLAAFHERHLDLGRHEGESSISPNHADEPPRATHARHDAPAFEPTHRS